jgi:hypothetical protein
MFIEQSGGADAKNCTKDKQHMDDYQKQPPNFHRGVDDFVLRDAVGVDAGGRFNPD